MYHISFHKMNIFSSSRYRVSNICCVQSGGSHLSDTTCLHSTLANDPASSISRIWTSSAAENKRGRIRQSIDSGKVVRREEGGSGESASLSPAASALPTPSASSPWLYCYYDYHYYYQYYYCYYHLNLSMIEKISWMLFWMFEKIRLPPQWGLQRRPRRLPGAAAAPAEPSGRPAGRGCVFLLEW